MVKIRSSMKETEKNGKTIRVGEKFLKVIEIQRTKIKNATWGRVEKASDKEICDMLAEKLIQKGLI